MEVHEIKSDEDIVLARHFIRDRAKEMGFGLVDQTKLTTVASELVRNILLYAGKGKVITIEVKNGFDIGLKIEFIDYGPGIENIELALKDGYTSGGGLGKGLPGSKRLVDDFFIETEKNRGTKITVIKWLRGVKIDTV
ncbi:MAG: anti-sigma regulatory factor [Bacteroidetes bacterium]|nr:anti-sigma regulatory factor [Bacteroidota bacterium]MBL6944372.1 anti-sigma regulatory factor [Bacteroidales bacterium]